ncbi:MAG: hypothetical protein FJX75_19645 [Armatimonadetes bacterium]|nr:hypothetical protein [Armatimonadota bacterium]
MSDRNPLTRTLIELVDDGLWGNPWHNLAEATSELTDDDLDYRPVAGATGPWGSDMARPSRYGARAIFRHLIGATLEAGELLPPHSPSGVAVHGEPRLGRPAALLGNTQNRPRSVNDRCYIRVLVSLLHDTRPRGRNPRRDSEQ